MFLLYLDVDTLNAHMNVYTFYMLSSGCIITVTSVFTQTDHMISISVVLAIFADINMAVIEVITRVKKKAGECQFFQEIGGCCKRLCKYQLQTAALF